MNILITGASRGIGLELVAQALARGDRVMACARKPENSAGLIALKKNYGEQLSTLDIDVTSGNAASAVAAAISSWPCLDIVINNAGIFRNGDTIEDFQASFHVNSVAPLFITRALLHKLKESKKPRSVQISSLMGSIEDNHSGGHYSYRASKAALNMITRCLAMDEPWLIASVLHPGWVQTDMGGKNAPTEISESVAGLWSAIIHLEKEDSGCFYDFQGDKLPW